MKKNVLFGICFSFFLCGCIQSTEHLKINPDGTGTLAVSMVVPKGTMQMIDRTMGGMMQEMAKAATSQGQTPELPQSIAEEMFGNKNTILKKAQKAGLRVNFNNFSSEKKGENLHVQYELTFDDVLKLGGSGVPLTRFEVRKNEGGDWILETREDKDRAKETQDQIGQLQQKPDLEKMSPEEKEAFDSMMESMKNLRIEFTASMPFSIRTTEGMFQKIDEQTAGLKFEGDLLDKEFYKKMEETANLPSRIVWASGGASPEAAGGTPTVDVTTTDTGGNTSTEVLSNTPMSVVHLKSGTVVNGVVIEKTADYIRLDIAGVEVKYYLDEIDRIE